MTPLEYERLINQKLQPPQRRPCMWCQCHILGQMVYYINSKRDLNFPGIIAQWFQSPIGIGGYNPDYCHLAGEKRYNGLVRPVLKFRNDGIKIKRKANGQAFADFERMLHDFQNVKVK